MLRYRVLRDGSGTSHLRAEERQVPKEPVSSDSVRGSRVPGFGEASEEHQTQRSPFPLGRDGPWVYQMDHLGLPDGPLYWLLLFS